jgi:hypothetical protein
MDLPCKVIVSVQEVSLQEVSTSGEIHRLVKCRELSLALEPVLAKIVATREGPGAGLYFKCTDFQSTEKSTVVLIPSLSGSTLVQFDQLDRMGNMFLCLEGALLSADFSSFASSASLESSSPPVKLPFVVVQEFELTLRCTGRLVSMDDTVLHCQKFEGDLMTTVDSLGAHYTGIVKRRIPYLLTKTEIMGSNVADSASMIAGSIATHSSILGATVGVAARDAVGAAITAGKTTRGASSAEKYKFGE